MEEVFPVGPFFGVFMSAFMSKCLAFRAFGALSVASLPQWSDNLGGDRGSACANSRGVSHPLGIQTNSLDRAAEAIYAISRDAPNMRPLYCLKRIVANVSNNWPAVKCWIK